MSLTVFIVLLQTKILNCVTTLQFSVSEEKRAWAAFFHQNTFFHAINRRWRYWQWEKQDLQRNVCTWHISLTSVIKYAVNLHGLNTKHKRKTKSSTEETCHLDLGFWMSLWSMLLGWPKDWWDMPAMSARGVYWTGMGHPLWQKAFQVFIFFRVALGE